MTVRATPVRLAVATVALVLALGAGPVAASSDDPPPTPSTVNDFIPEERDLSDCISALPKPDCGSDSHGGWRQGVVLALVLGGMIAIAVRVTVAVRRRDAEKAAQVEPLDAEREHRTPSP